MLQHELRIVLHHRLQSNRLRVFRRGARLHFRVHELRNDPVRLRKQLQIVLRVERQNVGIAREPTIAANFQNLRREPALVRVVSPRVHGAQEILQLVVLHIAHHLLAMHVLQLAQRARLVVTHPRGTYCFVGPAPHGSGDHVGMRCIGDGGSARHGVERQRVGVLEENEALHGEFVDPFGDNPVLFSIRFCGDTRYKQRCTSPWP